MKNKTIIEEQREIWDKLAQSWYNLKQKPFSNELERLVMEWNPGWILDIGCGHARNLLPFARRNFICSGIDFSPEMVNMARKFTKENNFHADLKVAEATKLPFPANIFDYCICIAVIHHLTTKKDRKKAFKEIERILKPGGKAYITVWNRLDFTFFFKPTDGYVDWTLKDKTVKRYYHFFTYWELKDLIKSADLEIEKDSGLFGRNIIFMVRKKKYNKS